MRMNHSILTIVVITAVFVTGCPEKKVVVKPDTKVQKVVKIKPAEAYYNDGLAAIEAGKLDQGLALLKQSLTKYKGNDGKLVDAHFNIGVVLMKQNDLDGAAAAYAEAIKIRPEHRQALLNLGVVYRRQNKFDKAIALYREALKKIPRDPKLMNNLIVVYRLNKEYKKAVKTGYKLLARAPTNVEAYKNMTLIYYDQKEFKKAELLAINAGKMLEKLRKEDKSIPEDAGIYNNLGMIFIGQKRFREAQSQFEKALKIDPNYNEALINIAAMAHRFRDYQRASKAYEQVLSKDRNNLIAIKGLAFAVFGMGDGKKSLELFEKVLQREPKDAQSIYTVGLIQDSLLRNYAKAVEYYKRYKKVVGKVSKSDPVHNRLQGAQARLEMARQMKADQAEDDLKQRKEEEKKRKERAAAARKDTTKGKAGQQKLQDMLKAGEDAEPAPTEGETQPDAGIEGSKDKAADKPKDKAADKPKDKTADKPKDKAADKPKDKTADKPKDKAADTKKDAPVKTKEDKKAG